MKKIFILLLLSLSLSFVFGNPLQDIKNFVFYYGEDEINKIESYDLAVVQPTNYSTTEIKEIESHGVKLIAYVSIGESDNKNVNPSWILAKNVNWDSYMIDVRNKGWRDYIINVVMKHIADMGYNGFFLDTLDTAVQFPQTENAMIEFVKEIREAYPQMIIIQNRGFPLLSQTGPYIDGVLWEDFASEYNFISGNYQKIDRTPQEVEQQVELSKKYGYRILTLSYAAEDDYDLMNYIFAMNKKYNLLGSITNLYINSIYTYKPGTPIPVQTYSSTNVSSELYFSATTATQTDQNSNSYFYGAGWSKPENIFGIWYSECSGWDAGAVVTFDRHENSSFMVIYFDGGINDFALQISAYDGTNWPMIASISIGNENMFKAALVKINGKYLYDTDPSSPGIQEKLGFKGAKVAYVGQPDIMQFTYGRFGYSNNTLTFVVRNVGLKNSKPFKIYVYDKNGNILKEFSIDSLGPNSDYNVSINNVYGSDSPLKVTIDPEENKEFNYNANTIILNF